MCLTHRASVASIDPILSWLLGNDISSMRLYYVPLKLCQPLIEECHPIISALRFQFKFLIMHFDHQIILVPEGSFETVSKYLRYSMAGDVVTR